jgi:hypothetical protein
MFQLDLGEGLVQALDFIQTYELPDMLLPRRLRLSLAAEHHLIFAKFEKLLKVVDEFSKRRDRPTRYVNRLGQTQHLFVADEHVPHCVKEKETPLPVAGFVTGLDEGCQLLHQSSQLAALAVVLVFAVLERGKVCVIQPSSERLQRLRLHNDVVGEGSELAFLLGENWFALALLLELVKFPQLISLHNMQQMR